MASEGLNSYHGHLWEEWFRKNCSVKTNSQKKFGHLSLFCPKGEAALVMITASLPKSSMEREDLRVQKLTTRTIIGVESFLGLMHFSIKGGNTWNH